MTRRITLRQYVCPACSKTRTLPLKREGFHYCDCTESGSRMQSVATQRAVTDILKRMLRK